MPRNEKKQQNPNRCELCAMPTYKNGVRHMERNHADLGE